MRAAAVLCLALCAGCAAAGPDPEAASPPLPDAYAFAVAEEPGMETAEPWWTGFDAPPLSALVERGLTENRDVAAALARLDAAAAEIGAARAVLFPSIDGEVALDASTALDGGETDSAGEAGALFSWTPDLFGRQRRAIEAARADAAAQAAIAADLRRLTAASIAAAYVDLARAEARVALLDTSLDLQRQTLGIVELRFDAGLSAGLDVERARADLARTEAQRGTLTVDRTQALNALAVLTGRTLAGWEPEVPDEIPAYRREIAPGVPAGLIRRRPDVREAEADLEAALARVGVARARLYPQLSLPGSITADLDPADFAGDVTAGIAAIVDVPLFDAGARRADVETERAQARAALADYEQAVLEAVADVEIALSRIAATEARRAELARAVEASENAFGQLDALYREGLATFIDILDAQRTLITSREDALEADAALAQAVIDLHAALGAEA